MLQRVFARPSANLNLVRLRVEGVDKIALDGDRLRLTTAMGEYTMPLLQVSGVTGRNLPRPNVTSDQVASPFTSVTLTPQSVIANPKSGASDLIYSTFLGGSAYDMGNSIAIDRSGAAYAAGYTLSPDFPTTPGAFDTTYNKNDAFVVKLHPTGSVLAYATFLGGGNYDEAMGIAVDGSGAAYVTGKTDSSDFPTTPGAFDRSCGTDGNCNFDGEYPIEDAFVVKLNATGSNLTYATFLGGGKSDYANAIAVDASGAAYITGSTKSSDFPTLAGAFDTTYNGGIYDAFVVNLNVTGSALTYATFLGGTENWDWGKSIAIDRSGVAYVTGGTQSSDFPVTPGAFDTSYNGICDAFVVTLNATGSTLAYATFLGGTDCDIGDGIAIEESGAVYITGETLSSNFPTSLGAFDATFGGGDCSGSPCSDAFAVKLNATGSALIYSTFLGGSAYDIGSGIAVDRSGATYITGYTRSSNFPSTPGAFDTTFGGGDCSAYPCSDAFVVKLNAAGAALAYATFLGGSSGEFAEDQGYGIAIDGSGVAYVTGQTHSSDFPVTLGAFDTSMDSSPDAFVVKLAMGGVVTYSISGLVTDASNNPISGVTISDGAGHTTTTDSNGNYTLGLTIGSYTITPSKSGYTFSPASHSVAVPPDATGQNFWGNVIPPIYSITLHNLQRFCSIPSRYVITNTSGVLANTTHVLYYDDGTVAGTFNDTISPGASKTYDLLTFSWLPIIYSGYVIVSSDQPVSGTVENNYVVCGAVNISGVTISDGAGHTVTTDSSGAYTLTGLAAGTYTITPSKSGYSFSPSSQSVTVPPNVWLSFTGTLLTYSISGRVTDSSNNPISGVAISDGAGHTATTDSNGYYALGGLAAGTYTLTPSKSGYTFSPASRNATVPPNAMGQNFTGMLTSACYTLTAAAQPSAGGTIAKSPAGNCNNGNGYTAGTVVKLTTTPVTGYRFVQWSGDASGTSATVNVTMTGNKSVTANLAQTSQTQKPVVLLVRGWGGPPGQGQTDSCDRNTVADHATDINNIPSWARDYFGVIARQLINDGMDVWFGHLNVGPGKTPIIEENAECLKWQLADIRAKTGVRQVVLIGHSMGGLVSRAYIEHPVVNFYVGDVSRLITLGTPHTGATGATFLALIGKACTANDPASCQFSTLGIDYFNQSYSNRAPQVIYNLIGGNLTPLLWGPLVYVTDGPNDGAVGANSAMGRKYRSRLFQPPLIETVIGGSNVTRYAIGAAHGNSFPTWHPNYFYTQQNNTTTPTETYQCIRQLLGISGGNCPTPTTTPAQPRTQTTSVLSRTPTLSGHLSTSQVATHTAPIDTSGFSQFSLTWTTGTLGFTLRNPLGTIIDPAYAAAHPTEVTYTENTTDPNIPLFATYSFTTTVPGTYTLTITAGNVGASGTDYAVSALVDSPRAVAVTTDSTLYTVGSTATITATLQNAGVGLTGATVQAQLYRTGVVTDTVTLTDQGGGNYTGTYIVPNAPGYLGLSVTTQGNDAGTAYARQVDNLLAISPPTVQLTGQYADNAVDSDSNGKLDALNLAIGVNSTQAGNYIFSGDLVTGGNIVAHGVISTTLTTGTIAATLPFSGDDIRQSGLNGPYTLTNLTITDQQNGGVPAVWKAANVHTTSAYNFADFAATCFVLTTNATTGGTISANPSPNCNGGLQYTSGTTVTLTASPNTGYTFLNWSGDASGSPNPVTVTMNGDKTVTADFAARLYLPLVLHNPVQESNPIYLPIILK
jgi:pimeloyl-ACP methyl ester carboxylesterase